MSAGPRSRALYAEAVTLMPAGVNSPVRAFGAVGGNPIFYESASGCRFTDADGRIFIDYVGSWGPLILGHADPQVVETVSKAAAKGLSYGAPCSEEIKLARIVVDTIEHIEMVRFVSSGTEAVMSAIRLARGATGRDAIVKFSGCYHGHADHLLVAAGSGLATFGTPSSAGVPDSFAAHTIVAPLDDDEAFIEIMKQRGSEIAAVIIEGIPANAGLLVQRPEFVRMIRDQCTEVGALLIFDEVITGFRIGAGGASAYYGITPDLTTYGKIIGGGLPVGAYGGRRDLMEHLAPLGPVYQAGTLSGNPVAMAAGVTTLRRLLDTDAYEELEAKGARLEAGIRHVFEKHGKAWSLARIGSILWIAFQPTLPRSFEDISPDPSTTYAALHGKLLDQGIYLAPSAYEVTFVSTAHDDQTIDETITAFDRAVGELP